MRHTLTHRLIIHLDRDAVPEKGSFLDLCHFHTPIQVLSYPVVTPHADGSVTATITYRECAKDEPWARIMKSADEV